MTNSFKAESCEQKCQHTGVIDANGPNGTTYQTNTN